MLQDLKSLLVTGKKMCNIKTPHYQKQSMYLLGFWNHGILYSDTWLTIEFIGHKYLTKLMFQCLRRELTWCQRSPEDHSASMYQPSHVSIHLSPQASRVCHGRFYGPVILSLLTWSSCRRPRHTRQSLLFSVWTADDLSAAAARDRNTVLLYSASDGAESRCPEVLPFQRRCPVMGHEAVTRTWTRDTGIRCSHAFLLTWISHFGGHTLTCLFQSSQREQSEKRISSQLF